MELSEIKNLQFDLTSACNLICPFCSRTKQVTKGALKIAHLPFSLIKEKFAPVLPTLEHVNFCGTFGEPTLHPEIVDILLYFRNNSKTKISVDTNGTTHSPIWWMSFNVPNFKVRFAVDGVSEETYQKYRIGSKFGNVIANMKAFIKGGGNAEWEFIVFKHNEHEIKKARDVANDIGCQINFKRSRNYSGDFEQPAHFDGPMRVCRKCKFIHKKELYISYDGVIEFCCRFQPRWMDKIGDRKLAKLYFGNLDRLNLHYNSLKQILGNRYIQYMENNFAIVCHKYIYT